MLSLDEDPPPLARIQAEQDSRQFGPPGTHQARDAQNFSAVQGETDVLDDAGLRNPLHLEQRLRPAVLAGRGGKSVCRLRPTISEIISSTVNSARRPDGLDLAVAQDDDRVAQSQHVAQVVRDVNHRRALAPQAGR